MPFVQEVPTPEGMAYVIDSILEDRQLEWIDSLRCSLALDSKRPTVDRRFFADGPGHQTKHEMHRFCDGEWDARRPMAHLLERAIRIALFDNNIEPDLEQDAKDTCDNEHAEKCAKGISGFCHVFRYQRFLEYNRAGSGLDAHTDGTKICDDTSLSSTHTLLLYLTDCVDGGGTLLWARKPSLCDTACSELLLHETKPRRGRILLFPHATWHEGAAVISLPKICLRAEVCLSVTLREEAMRG